MSKSLRRWLPALGMAAGLCPALVAMAQPANDSCAVVSAGGFDIPATGGSVSGTTALATADGDCTCDLGTPGRDVYYRFTPSSSGTWELSLCSTAVTIDTVLSVHSSACPANTTTQLVCDDDTCGVIGGLSRVTFALTGGTTYLIRVGMWSNTAAGGAFTLSVANQSVPGNCCDGATGLCSLTTTGSGGCASGTTFTAGGTCTPNPCPQPPANDLCASAEVIAPGASVSATGSLALASPVTALTPAVCIVTSRDVYYSFTPTVSNTYTVTTCNTVTGSLDTVVSVHSGCPGDGSDVLACNDDSCTGGIGASTIPSFAMDAGTTYIIRVARYNTNVAGGPFRLDITSGAFGSCCAAAGTCMLTAQTSCTGTSTFLGGATCSTAACQGTCCDTATAACTLVGAASACPTGTFGGLGTSCTPVPCVGQACCNATTGACTLTGTDACPSGTTGQGAGTTCNPNPCPQPPPPANDDCATVLSSGPSIPAAGGTVIGDTQFATNDGNCACDNAAGKDVYFSFTPSATGGWSFSLCATAVTIDTTVSVHTGCPADDLNQIACDDDACGTIGGLSVAFANLTGGTTYLIRVGMWSATGVGGPFSLTASPATLGACCNDGTGACTSSTTGAAGCASGTTYQGDGSSCTPSPCPIQACCNAATGGCTVVGTVACPSGTTGQGAGTVCTPNPCPQPPPPANDVCSSATNLNSVATFPGSPFTQSGSNTTATNDGVTPDEGACNTGAGEGLDNSVWYQWTPAASGTLRIQVSTTSGAYDIIMVVYSGADCTALTEVDDPTCGGDGTNDVLDSVDYTVHVDAGTTYFLGLGDWGVTDGGGPFDLTLSFVSDTPSGVCCRGGTCTTTITTATACTGSLISGQTAGASFSSAAACNAAVISNSPCCYADYNKTGGVTVTDIFNFLTDWFAGSPFANIGGTGAAAPLAVQNIFDFLTNWFAGGC